MSMIRKMVRLQAGDGAANRSKFVAATNQLARDGHVLEPRGMQVENFLNSGTILFDHDPKAPIASPVTAVMNADGDLEIEIEWAPDGVSPEADKVRGLVKAGILRAGSVGFEPLDAEPLDPKKPRGGLHITRSELLEFSVVSVGADTGAVVTQRSNAGDWKCGVSRDLPIEDSDAWDGPAAEESIFAWAGGDDFDPTKARKGFLAYNAAKPKERGSYKLPLAHVVDGRMKVPKGAIRAAASRLPQADIPADVEATAREVLDHYEEKAGMKDGKDRSAKVTYRPLKRGLYEVASLAYMLEQLGYAHACSEYEAEIEGDASKVPAMLGEALTQFGAALIAMTSEEVNELLAGKDLEIEDADPDEIVVEERAFVAAGKTVRARAWRRGVAMARAGRTLSASNEKKLEAAQGHHARALKHHKALGDSQKEAGSQIEAAQASNAKATKAHGDLGDALASAKNEPDKAPDHIARAVKAHKALGSSMSDMADMHAGMADTNQDGTDSHAAMGRSIKAAQRSVQAVVDGSTPGSEDGDSKDVQTSADTEDSTGSEGERSVDYRRRQSDLLALAS